MTLSVYPARTLLAAALALAAAPALAQTYSQTVFIGDSLTDAGYFRPLLPPSAQPVIGQFTTNPGFVWSQYLADFYGTSAAPNGNGQGGPNYAAGGARVGVDVVGPLGFIPSLVTQTNTYLAANGGRADPNALYTVWGGANDLFAVAADPSQAQAIIGGAVTAQIGIVGTLQAAGARYVIVPTIPDIGVTPSSLAGDPAGQAQGTALATAYNTALFGGLASAGLSVIPLDTFHFLQEVVANPAQYGFSNVTGTACLPPGSSSLTCSPAAWASPDAPNTYLFADGVHPTSGAHRIVADLAVSALEGPRLIAVLPHSAAMVGRARADRIGAHIAGKPDSDGTRWWADARGDFQRYGDGDEYDGVGPALTGGVDWTSGNLVFGAFGGYGRQFTHFGQRRGDFEQLDATLGGFAGWYGDNAWVNGQASYTQLSYDIDREVWLGPAKRSHTGSPDGSNISVALNAGWDFEHGALTHGPVIGVLSQQIEIDGYSESQPALSTSLAYPEQEFDSLIGNAGWQASYAINAHLKPYARLTYDREFEDAAEQAFARSQSLPGTLPYAVPGLEYDDSYGTLTFGAQTQLFGLDANMGSAVTVGQKGGNHATVFATVGRGF
ncbi:MAG: autotransporter domain-containing protein [Luteimonas sp.]|nr:autotransporter domain-containing protein [Luteimonas sp.]